jgi:pyruvate dehydrogenase E1 component alpha subunit/2-oxoisovalerate dehydrogenase E1 component alpha subunit
MPADRRLALYRWMHLARRSEERLGSLYRQGAVAGGVYLGKGQEALSGALGMHLRPGDIFATGIRDLTARLAFGEPMLDGMRTHLGRSTGPMRGRDGNIHRGRPETGLLSFISHLGAMTATVAGGLMARRLAGRLGSSIGAVSLGDGAMATGAAHEGLNVIGVERLPVVVVVANNQLSYSTTNDRSFACDDLVRRAAAYGLVGHNVDGEDADACLEVLGAAVAAARNGQGPQMVVGRLLRLCGHGEHDDATYTPAHMRAVAKDCLLVLRERLLAAGHQDAIERTEQANEDEIARAINQARSEAEPDPKNEDWAAYSERWLTEGLRQS